MTSRATLTPFTGTWIHHAACTDHDAETFFPHDTDTAGIAIARRICNGCPVKTHCLHHALTTNERFGVWGGLTETQRANLHRRTNRRRATT